jgi:F-type H+-transporting ATPase subunit a
MEHEFHVAIAAQELTQIWGFPVTNSFVMGLIVLLVVVVFALVVSSVTRLRPGKFQIALELVLSGYHKFIAENLGGKDIADRFFPLLMSLIIFIFFANFLEFIPGVESIMWGHGEHAVPFLRSLNADLNTTIALAVIAFLTIEITGIRRFGIRYFSRFFNFHSFMGFFVGLIELISELIRLVSFSFRLFGNIFAGGILIGVLTFFVPYILPAPFMVFEMFVGLLQGVVFSLLTLFFVKMAITETEH